MMDAAQINVYGINIDIAAIFVIFSFKCSLLSAIFFSLSKFCICLHLKKNKPLFQRIPLHFLRALTMKTLHYSSLVVQGEQIV